MIGSELVARYTRPRLRLAKAILVDTQQAEANVLQRLEILEVTSAKHAEQCGSEKRFTGWLEELQLDPLELITTRVSIRDYKPEPVPRDLQLRILEAARWAPSGDNFQPWRFILVEDQGTKTRIGEICVRAAVRSFGRDIVGLQKRFAEVPEEKRKAIIEGLVTGRRFKFIAEAPTLLAVCADTSITSNYLQDVSAAIENMLLAAHGLGLGACWIGLPLADEESEKQTEAALGISGNIKLVALVTVGYPSRVPKPRPRLPLKDLVYINRYGNREGLQM